MSALSDYLMKHHFSAMSNNDTVLNAALEVIQAQDKALDEARKVIEDIQVYSSSIVLVGKAEKWLEKYPK